MTADGFGEEVREVGEVAIIRLQGKLRLGAATQSVRELVSELLERGRTSVILELKDLNYIDSAGLGTLMACYTSARSRGGNLKLLSPSGRVRDQLLMMKLMPVFEVFEEESTAVSSFAKAAGTAS